MRVPIRTLNLAILHMDRTFREEKKRLRRRKSPHVITRSAKNFNQGWGWGVIWDMAADSKGFFSKAQIPLLRTFEKTTLEISALFLLSKQDRKSMNGPLILWAACPLSLGFSCCYNALAFLFHSLVFFLSFSFSFVLFSFLHRGTTEMSYFRSDSCGVLHHWIHMNPVRSVILLSPEFAIAMSCCLHAKRPLRKRAPYLKSWMGVAF